MAAAGGGGAGPGGKIRSRRYHLSSGRAPYSKNRLQGQQGIISRVTDTVKSIVPGWLQNYFNKNETSDGVQKTSVSVVENAGNKNSDIHHHIYIDDDGSPATNDGRITPEPVINLADEDGMHSVVKSGKMGDCRILEPLPHPSAEMSEPDSQDEESQSSLHSATASQHYITESSLRKLLATQTRSITQEIQRSSAELKEISEIGDRVDALERKQDDQAEDQSNILAYAESLAEQISQLESKLADMEDRSRWCNITFRGVPESVSTADIQGYVQGLFQELIGAPDGLTSTMERAHRPLRPRTVSSDKPRDIIVCFHSFLYKDSLLQAAYKKTNLSGRFEGVQLLPDLSAHTLQQRLHFQPITTALRKANIRYRWGFPTRFIVTKDNQTITISTPSQGLTLLTTWGLLMDPLNNQAQPVLRASAPEWTAKDQRDAKRIPSVSSSPLSFTPEKSFSDVEENPSKRKKVDSAYPPVKKLMTPKSIAISTNRSFYIKPSLTPSAVANTTSRRIQTEKHREPRRNHDPDQPLVPQSESNFSYPKFSTPASNGLSPGGGGKMMRGRGSHYTTKLADEETEVPTLPEVPLPLSTAALPSFNFSTLSSTTTTSLPVTVSKPADSKVQTDVVNKNPMFTFSSPIVKSTESNAQSPGSSVGFTFSVPSVKSSSPPITVNNTMFAIGSPAKTTIALNNGSAKKEEEKGGFCKPAKELKEGSVMDILRGPGFSSPSSSQTASPTVSKSTAPLTKPTVSTFSIGKVAFGEGNKQALGLWQCNTCLVENKASDGKCVACSALKEQPAGALKSQTTSTLLSNTKNSDVTSTQGFGDIFKVAPGTWECETCLVQNKPEVIKCVACETPKPGAGVKPALLLTPSTQAVKAITTSDKTLANAPCSLFEAFKKPEGSWECSVCCVQNKEQDSKCVACTSEKPGSSSSVKTATLVSFTPTCSNQLGLTDVFKRPEGSWDCDVCLIQNKPEATKCVACENNKPGTKAELKDTEASKQTFGLIGSGSSATQSGASASSSNAFGSTVPTGASASTSSLFGIAAQSSTPSGSSGLFGSTTQSTTSVSTSGVFGSIVPTSAPVSTSSVFGITAQSSTSAGSSGLFGSVVQSSASAGSGSVFGTAASSSTPAGSSSVFGNSASSITPAGSSSVFGNAASSSTPAGSTSVFGSGAPSNAPAGSSSVFGSAATSTTPANSNSVFGSATPITTSSSSIFGAAPTSTSANSSSIFGNSTTTSNTLAGTFMFGQPSSTAGGSVFGSTTESKSSFVFSGQESKPATTSTSTPVASPFQFGANPGATNPVQGFNFGGANASNVSGSASTPSPFVFGASSSAPAPSALAVSANTVPAFGQSASQTNVPAFGSSSTLFPSGSQNVPAFGSVSSTSQPPAFGQQATQPSFGSSPAPAPGSGFQFGGNTNFNFASGASSGVFTFGSSSAGASTQPAQSGFMFNQTPTFNLGTNGRNAAPPPPSIATRKIKTARRRK
ncbi:nuclear pore complex protein Nup153 [Bombina bombina]|uniref:nuclear pore complex protein Nup153 n=1 Tax=Bombina bombina TaxID=8345 RepID=UPI00235AEF9A|nr:nuclear pore complex protein Nup153 [Bombina bombina]